MDTIERTGAAPTARVRIAHTRTIKDGLFWAKVSRAGPDDCWSWTASKNEKGYGQFAVKCEDGKWRPMAAHRIAYALTKGRVPADMLVLHRCDNPSCVNPAHLFLGTPAENTLDMVTKRRQQTKLSADDIHEIFRLSAQGLSQGKVAMRFGVDQTLIGKILRGAAWAHISREMRDGR